jgi:phosphoenolpyruvate phosphomutase
MLALILNSGQGSRMGEASAFRPKCLTTLDTGETILGRQLRLLQASGVNEFIITTGPFPELVEKEVSKVAPEASVIYVKNNLFKTTNYIYSIYLAREYLNKDMLLLHGDLVFDESLISEVLNHDSSLVTVFPDVSTMNKDFKAVIENGQVKAIGISFFKKAVSLQPLYRLGLKDWRIWLKEIERFVSLGLVKVYAEEAFNEISAQCSLLALQVSGEPCLEIDDLNDLARANLLLTKWKQKL